ncbi:MAG: hypothetical protein HRT94_07225 [Alphaproteobacteria bacterium]|nr:hypothetical protein [Alphaproteobacteria bacterium]
MTEAKLRYAIGLPTDDKTIGKTTYDNALSLLKAFITSHDGEYIGPFKQDGIEYPDHAVVSMPKATERLLTDYCEAAHGDPNTPLFVRRDPIPGLHFDIVLADELRIEPDIWAQRFARMGIQL